MGKEDAPQGPDYNKLLKQINVFVQQNQDLFREAMSFGKDQFSKGEEWVQRLSDFGMDARGRLNTQADTFGKKVNERVGQLDKYGREWGQGVSDVYKKNQALADKVTGELMPGLQSSAELGGTLLNRYTEQGIPFQDEYIAKLRGWDSPERQAQQAGMAVNDVAMATEAAREAELQKLAQYGIDPSQTRAASLDARLQVQAAVAKATAANQARQRVQAEGLQTSDMASDLYNESLAAGRGMVESATGQAGAIADIARQPGADRMSNLAALGQYGQGVAGLEQAGGNTAFNMRQIAEQLGLTGLNAGAAQQNTTNNYGSNLYDQGRAFLGQSGSMTSGAYGTAGSLNANDIARVAENNKNSFGGQIGQALGFALPIMAGGGIPGIGAAAAGAAAGGAPAAGTGFLQNIWNRFSEGGAIPEEMSPSGGALRDDVRAKLSVGEFVFDEPTTRWFGEKHLRNMQAQAKKGLGIPENAAA